MRRYMSLRLFAAGVFLSLSVLAANVKTSELGTNSTPDTDDFLVMVRNATSVYTSMKVSVSTFLTEIGLLQKSDSAQWYNVPFTIPNEPDDDAQHFEIQVSANATFDAFIVNWDTRSGEDGVTGCTYFSGTIWEAWPGTGVTAPYEGSRGCYSFQSASIVRGTRYYIRIRFHDGTSWGDYAGDLMSW